MSKCGDCKHRVPLLHKDAPVGSGECRRFPPIPITFPHGTAGGVQLVMRTVFPVVMLDSPPCGEWSPEIKIH